MKIKNLYFFIIYSSDLILFLRLDSKKFLDRHFLYGSAPYAGVPTKINLGSLVLKSHLVPVSIDVN